MLLLVCLLELLGMSTRHVPLSQALWLFCPASLAALSVATAVLLEVRRFRQLRPFELAVLALLVGLQLSLAGTGVWLAMLPLRFNA